MITHWPNKILFSSEGDGLGHSLPFLGPKSERALKGTKCWAEYLIYATGNDRMEKIAWWRVHLTLLRFSNHGWLGHATRIQDVLSIWQILKTSREEDGFYDLDTDGRVILKLVLSKRIFCMNWFWIESITIMDLRITENQGMSWAPEWWRLNLLGTETKILKHVWSFSGQSYVIW
jgi:hypothetical protein